MIDLRQIKARYEAARLTCVAYWLLVFVYFMVQAFPVNDYIEVAGFHSGSSSSIVVVECDDPALPVDPIIPPPSPRVAEIIPICGPVSHIKKHFKAEASFFPRHFDPRGPPLTT